MAGEGREPFKRSAKVLRSGEQSQLVIRRARNGPQYGDLVLTTERVVYVRSNWFHLAVDEFPLERIDAVSSSTGMLMGEIALSMSGRTIRFGRLGKKETVTMAEAIRAAVDMARDSSSGDLADLIRRLKQLRDDGVLSEDEFDRAKGRYLGRDPNEREAMLRTLTGLNDLRKAGVLTQVEFDIKKRDYLATAK